MNENVLDHPLNAITSYMATNLPSRHLMHQAKTDHQKQVWNGLRNTLYAVGASWWSKNSFQDNPVYAWLENGLIDQCEYDYYEALVDVFQELWDLIQASEPFIRKEALRQLQSYPFEFEKQRSAELLKTIIKSDTNSVFETCLQYVEVNIPQHDAAMRLFKARLTEEPERKTYSKRLKGRKTPPGWSENNFWLKFSIGVCKARAKTDKNIRHKLCQWEAALVHWAELEIAGYKGSKSFTASPSGVIKTGKKEGGTYT
jgi:hypothetical protein